MSERIGHGLVRTPGGRVREMTEREIARHAEEMERFGERVLEILDTLPPNPPAEWYRFVGAICLAEDKETS